jgi:hypothetical protein
MPPIRILKVSAVLSFYMITSAQNFKKSKSTWANKNQEFRQLTNRKQRGRKEMQLIYLQ